MQSYQQDAIRIYLTVARHLVLQGVRCDFERRFVVVHPEDIRIRDPLGACLAMKTVLHEPKLYGYTGGLSDPFLAKLLQEAGVDLNNPLVSRALHQLVSIHDKFSSLRWSIVLKERFEVLFPGVEYSRDIADFVHGDKEGPAGLNLARPEPSKVGPDMDRLRAIHEELNRLEDTTEAAGHSFDFALKSAYESLGKDVFQRFLSSNRCAVDTVILKQAHLQDQLDTISNLSGKALTSK